MYESLLSVNENPFTSMPKKGFDRQNVCSALQNCRHPALGFYLACPKIHPMILSGARGKLLSIDSDSKTIKLFRRSKEENYEYTSEFDAKKYSSLVGKNVDLDLCDFVVIGIAERND